MKFIVAILARFITCMLDTPSILFKGRLHQLFNELSLKGFVVRAKHFSTYSFHGVTVSKRYLSRVKMF